MVRSLFMVTLLAVTAALNGCRDVKEDDYYSISGKVFIFNYRIATATYVVTLNNIRPVPEGSVALASFENPAGGEALTVKEKIWPKSPKLSLESPPLSCVVKDKPYSFSIQIVDSGGKVIQDIKSTLKSTLDQSVLPDRPLVIGQGYEPNPEMVGHPDGRLPQTPKIDCPV